LKLVKLHLGCGPRHIPGFVHVDAQPGPHIDIVGPVEKLPVPDASATLVYASHVLEHFGRFEYKAVLKEWHRVLAPGGTLRLAVPDFAACAALYYESGLSDRMSGLAGLLVGGQRDAYDFHKMVFDENSLRADLLEAGFTSVRRWDWRTTEHAGVDDYSQAYIPHLRKDDGRLMSLNLEADRPR
jgi:predicted SAM-dependent methyltransferase